MSNDRWNEVRRLFNAALDLPVSEREAFVRNGSKDDQLLIAEVMALLAEESEEDFLSPPPAEEPVSFGDFELREEIGSGGTGIVYRAWQRSLSREVALKLLPRHFSLNQERVQRFQREARAAAKLMHPGIAPIYEVGHEGDSHFFTMELIHGRDLAGELVALRENTPSSLPKVNSPEYFRAVASIVERCADALAYAHEKGVVHRDVKPHNILLDPTGQPRLVDFGLAKDEALGSITITDRVEGTPYYMSPEQALALKGKIDARTDVYSLGAVLYELLTLARPYEGRTSKEIIDKILVRDPKPVRSVNSATPRDLAIICTKAMERELAHRYKSAAAFKDDLARFLAGEPIHAAPPSLLRRATRVCKRNQFACSGVLTLGLSVLCLSWGQGVLERRTWQEFEIEVLFSDKAVDPTGMEIYAIGTRVDSFTGEPMGARERYEVGPSGAFQVGEGKWRFDVIAEGYGFSTLTRNVKIGREARSLRARIHPSSPATQDMVLHEPRQLPFTAFNSTSLTGNPKGVPFLDREGSLTLEPFYLSCFEVSFGQFRSYLLESGDAEPAGWGSRDVASIGDNMPVVMLSPEEARAYAEWQGLRLSFCTELESASRGADWSALPWGGSDADPEKRANIHKLEVSERAGLEGEVATYLLNAEPVDSRPEAATPSGLFNTLGNVNEWTESVRQDETNPFDAGADYVFYGGSWNWSKLWHGFPASQEVAFGDYVSYRMAGIRCAKSAKPLSLTETD